MNALKWLFLIALAGHLLSRFPCVHFSFPCCFQRLYSAAEMGLPIQHNVIDAGADSAADWRVWKLGRSHHVSWTAVSALSGQAYQFFKKGEL